jgi:micrococcal nuclease
MKKPLKGLYPSISFLILLLSGCSAAGGLSGRVVQVVDGDTVWVQTAPPQSERHKVRLDGIDAPERCQTGGAQAKEILKQRLLNQTIELQFKQKDDHGRLLATIYFEGENINAWMVSQGQAWNYRWKQQQGPYQEEEENAQQLRRGIFSDSGAIEPRKFRQSKTKC